MHLHLHLHLHQEMLGVVRRNWYWTGYLYVSTLKIHPLPIPCKIDVHLDLYKSEKGTLVMTPRTTLEHWFGL
jgi:hypothetical protein